MNSFWPYLSFILGSLFALLLQWVAYRLSFKKDQRKEYWIRKLNSYQDFYQHVTQLIGLIKSNVKVPEHVYWQSISLARKAAYDASFFDKENHERTIRMQNITTSLIQILQENNYKSEHLEALQNQVQDIQENFYKEEKI